MYLVALELENFRQHRKTSIEFLSGVTAVIGKNGSGKTTVLEAIAWALYGSPAIRGKNDTLRCRGAEGDAPVEVKLTFIVGPHTYTVTRRLEPSGKSTANIAVDGVHSRAGFKEVTEAVTRLMGMDYQAFFTSFFTAQKELEFMRGLTGRDRAKAISQMLGYERIVRARDKANQDRLAVGREIAGLEQGLANPEEIKQRKTEASKAVADAEKSVRKAEKAESAARKEMDRLKPLKELSEQKSKRYTEISRRLDLDKAEEKRASDRLMSIKQELSDIGKKEAELAAILPQVKEFEEAEQEYRKLSELQKDESKRRELAAQIKMLGGIVESCNSRIKDLAGAADDLIKAEKSIADLDKRIQEVTSQIECEKELISRAKHTAEAEIHQISVQRADIIAKRKAIEDAGVDGKCPTCERPLHDELPKVLAEFDSQIERFTERESKLCVEIQKLSATPESLSALITLSERLGKERECAGIQRAELTARLAELKTLQGEVEAKSKEEATLQSEVEKLATGFDQERFDRCMEIGRRLKPVQKRSIELKASVERKGILESDLAVEQAALKTSSSEIAKAVAALKELSFLEADHISTLAAYESASSMLNSASIALETARGDLRAAQAAFAGAEEAETAYRKRAIDLDQKKRERAYLQTLADALDGLRSELSNRTAPELAAAASDLLSEMTDGRYSTVELDDNYEALIRDDGEIKEVISGGEQDVLNLALRLAVSQMITDRAGQEMSLLVLDEVFGSLDDIRRDNLVTLLQTLKSRFEQIILITHVDSIHDAVDNSVWVEFDESTRTSSVSLKIESDEEVSIAQAL